MTEPDTFAALLRAGRIVGWALLVLGLMGFLCGTFSHMKKGSASECPYHGQMGAMMAPSAPSMPKVMAPAPKAAPAPVKKPAAKPTR